ncbi:MAG: winged helix DNA-binding protein [Eubacteriales bacterium]|nr:winged helix DNA-binding protein [Eubacteriales bacterium]
MGKIRELDEWFRLFKEYDDIFHELSRKMGLSDSAFIIFYGICSLGNGCLQKDICDSYYIRKQTVNSSIRSLEQDGYIYLESGNGRDMHLYLTPKGQAFSEKNIRPVIQIEQDAFLEMEPSERSAMVELTVKYVSLIKNKAKKLSFSAED